MITGHLNNLEIALADAKEVQEQIKSLEIPDTYLPPDEVRIANEKSAKRVADAEAIHTLIEKTKQIPGFMSDQDIERISEEHSTFNRKISTWSCTIL